MYEEDQVFNKERRDNSIIQCYILVLDRIIDTKREIVLTVHEGVTSNELFVDRRVDIVVCDATMQAAALLIRS